MLCSDTELWIESKIIWIHTRKITQRHTSWPFYHVLRFNNKIRKLLNIYSIKIKNIQNTDTWFSYFKYKNKSASNSSTQVLKHVSWKTYWVLNIQKNHLNSEANWRLCFEEKSRAARNQATDYMTLWKELQELWSTKVLKDIKGTVYSLSLL